MKNPSNVGISSGKANITVSWSPCGGVGSTTVALAYALNKTENKKNALYINMEPLSSLSYYFQDSDKGLSYALQKLDSNINNILLSLIQNDSYTGINYIDSVDNYNDLNIVSVDEIDKLISALSTNAEEIIIDLSSQTGEVAQAILERANNILLVVDNKPVSNVKLNCFIKQHNIFNKVKRNITLVNNQNAGINVADIDRTISLPRINQNEPSNVFKELSKYFQKGN